MGRSLMLSISIELFISSDVSKLIGVLAANEKTIKINRINFTFMENTFVFL